MWMTRCDFADLEKMTRRFRREVWQSVPYDAVVEGGVEVRDFGPIQVTVFEEIPEARRLNTIEGVAEPGAVADGHLAEAVDWIRSREVDYRVVVASCRPEAGAATEWLAKRGFEPGLHRVKYVREARPPHLPVLSGVEVLEANHLDHGEGVAVMAQEGLGLPLLSGTLFFGLPIHEKVDCYIALLNDRLAGCGAMLVEDGIAALGIEATAAWARRHGCHQALITRRLLDAVVAECHTVFTEVAQRQNATAAHRNLLCAGFENAYSCQDWHRPNT